MAQRFIKNQYKICKLLGTGGSSQVFLAEDKKHSNRCCVIKQFKPVTRDSEKYKIIKERFLKEAGFLGRIRKGNDQIPILYDSFSQGKDLYLVQEWIEGDTLAQKVRKTKTPLDEVEVKQILANILPVLDHIHSQRYIHRDIKPSNIILRKNDSKPVLIDFATVKEKALTSVDDDGKPTDTLPIGTQGYMPLEQLVGNPHYSSDLYALGCTAIFLLTRKHPSDLGNSPDSNMEWQGFAKDTSQEFVSLIDKAIEWDKKKRFQTAHEMLLALEDLDRPEIEEATETQEYSLAIAAGLQASDSIAARYESAKAYNLVRVSEHQVSPEAEKVVRRGKRWWDSKYVLGGLIVVLIFGLCFLAWDYYQRRPYSQLKSGLDYLEKQEYDSAIENFSKALVLKEDFYAAYWGRAASYLGKCDCDKAIADFTTALNLQRDDQRRGSIYMIRAECFIRKGELDKAIEDCSEAININKINYDAYVLRGRIFARKNDLNKALEDFNQAINVDSSKSEAYFYRANAFMDKEVPNLAKTDLDKYINLVGNKYDAYYNRALANAQKKQSDKAVEDLSASIILNKEYPRTYYERARIYYDKGNYDAAIEDITQAVSIWNKKSEDYKNAVASNSICDCNPNYIDMFEADDEKDRTINPFAYFYRGLAYYYKGDLDGAVEDLSQASVQAELPSLSKLVKDLLKEKALKHENK